MAEFSQKIVRCSVCGQYYDVNAYPKCPYCYPGNPTVSGSSGTIAVEGMSPTSDPYAGQYAQPNGTEIGGTIPIDAGTVGPTVPVGYSQDVTNRSSMSQTIFADTGNPAGSPMPVVGWLVAVEGPCRGTDYRVHTGYNYIGRESGDICIRGDNTISAVRDSNIAYVPQTNKFYIAHEQGKNVLLVNDLPVIGGGTEIKSYDRITIGTTQMLFVAFCGEQFRWDERKG